MHFTVITLFPDMFPGPLGDALLGRALQKGLWSLSTVDIRRYGNGAHKQVDDTPYGGSAGMVLRADVVSRALEDACEIASRVGSPSMLYLSPRGKPLTMEYANALAKEKKSVVLLCGRYEGIDARILDTFPIEEVSVGDVVLMGGEIPAMMLIEAVARLLPGVLGDPLSSVHETFHDNLLEHPHYTRPQVFRGISVPSVLSSGNHGLIERWREEKSHEITQQRRPDLWAKRLEYGIQTIGLTD